MTNDRPRFLFASPGVPGRGGASTACYQLFRRVQAGGRDVHFVNLIKERTAPSIASIFGPHAGNPLALADVLDCDVSADPSEPQPSLRSLITKIAPDVVVAFDHRSTCLVARAAPDRRFVFVTASCRQAQDYVVSGRAPDAVTLGEAIAGGRLTPRPIHAEEARAVSLCALVIPHSALTLSFFEQFYPGHAGKLYPSPVSFAEWIADSAVPFRHLARPFAERDVEVCVVATDWSRPEKNYRWVEEIARRIGAGRVHVVGNVPRPISGARHHGFLATREALAELLGRARCVLSVSRIDAAPGVLFEASVLGCNVVASRNCGNWQLCNAELLVDPFSLDGFITAIGRASTRKYEDNLEAFLATGSYEDFVATLDAFAHPFAPVAAEA